MKRFLLALFILVMLSSSIFSSSDILLSDVPVSYGEDSFRQRILERTEGKRDPVGLVLTGGSARALAHLGVLEYLEEENIEPDYIISNSMGSIIALLYSAGLDSQQIVDLLSSADLSDYFALTIPYKGGLIDNTSFKSVIESIVGEDMDIKDLPIPVMVICDDLVTEREVRIMEGNFADVLAAAFAMPVYFAPAEYRGHYLIDGGVIELAPVNAAYEFSDTVILSTTFYSNDNLNILSPITVLNTAFSIGKNQRSASAIKAHEDLIWIRCAVEGYSFMDFKKVDEMRKIGYESAKASADLLKDIYRSGSSLADERTYYEERVGRAIDNIRYFHRVETADVANIISFRGGSYAEGKMLFLNNSTILDATYLMRYRFIDFSLNVGGAFNLSGKEYSASSDTSVNLSFYPFARMRIALDASIYFSDSPRPDYYLAQSFDYRFYSSDYMDIGFVQSFEYRSVKEKKMRYMLSLLFDASFEYSIGESSIRAGYQSGGSSFAEYSSYAYIDAKSRFSLPFSLYLDITASSRFTLDGKKSVPLFLADGYFSNTVDSATGRSLSSSYFVTPSIEFGYRLPFSPTFSELFIIESLTVGLFFNTLIYENSFEFITGLRFEISSSLIGMVGVPFSVALGYDSKSESFLFSLSCFTRF